MKASVCMITYNHEEYIRESIESVLKQDAPFAFELVIGEDGSRDKTKYICEEYSIRYPHIIRLLPSEGNLGMMKNFIKTLEACKGDYIAFIEGDDYWTDPHKLKKQLNFLDANPEYSTCFHNTIVKSTLQDKKREWLFHKQLLQTTFYTDDLLQQWFVPSASVVFRKYRDFALPGWFQHCQSGDIPFLLLLSLRGKIRYLDEVMSVYRVHDKGISSSHVGYEKMIAMVFIYENFNIYTNRLYHKKVREAMIYEIERHLPSNQRRARKKERSIGTLYTRLKKFLFVS